MATVQVTFCVERDGIVLAFVDDPRCDRTLILLFVAWRPALRWLEFAQAFSADVRVRVRV